MQMLDKAEAIDDSAAISLNKSRKRKSKKIAKDDIISTERTLIDEVEPPSSTSSSGGLGDEEPDSAAKKSKPEEYEEIKEDLQKCEKLLQKETTSLSRKLQCLSNLFEDILQQNVNTHVLKTDFPTWVKSCIQIVLKDVKIVSDQFFDFLTLSLKVAPTIFEPILENILKACIFVKRETVSVQLALNAFMRSLITTFEKLRRFPKLIAKLLCCLRDNLCVHKETFEESHEVLEKISEILLSKSFYESTGPVITLLPPGQIFDLWKTLQHNLDAECLTPICSSRLAVDQNRIQFLSIVVDLIAEFFSNIKVTDFTIPGVTVDKIAEMMASLRDDIVKRFGVELIGRKFDIQLTKPFLKLAYSWAELNQMLKFYNSKYKLESTIGENSTTLATDLSCLHPYLKSSEWTKLCDQVLKTKDASLNSLMVRLVSQKLLYSINADAANVEELKNAAEFVWTHQIGADLSDEALILVTQYIEPSKIIQVANNVVQQPKGNIFLNTKSGLDSSDNPIFHYSLILESLKEILKRISKMKLLSKPIASLLEDPLSVETRENLILEFTNLVHVKKDSKNSNNTIVTDLLNAVNDIIESSSKNRSSKNEFSSEMITDILQSLLTLDLEVYPIEVKTIVFLCSLVILLALAEQSVDDNIFDLISKTVADSGSKSHGSPNPVMFSIHWISLFKWFTMKIQRFSYSVQRDIFQIILSNIYISPKLIGEFECQELNRLVEMEELNSGMGHLTLMALEFYTEELATQGTKTNKLTPQIQKHAKKLTDFAVEMLSKSTFTEESNDLTQYYSNIFRACWLCTLTSKVMSEDILASFNQILETAATTALKLIKMYSTCEDESNEEMLLSCKYALKFILSLCKSKEVSLIRPKHFTSKIWKACFRSRVWFSNSTTTTTTADKSILPKHFAKDLMEIATTKEFKKIGDTILETVGATIQENQADYKMVMAVLNEFIDAELTTEKHNLRRHVVQEFLHVSLVHTVNWSSDMETVTNVIIPYIDFQTKLLRRRNALINLRSLAICLLSATSAPLLHVKDIATFRKLFCTVGDLMNAFAVHRLDVISIRAHVVLQCFQHLCESLGIRADQKNKLCDEDISHLRHCAHSIERICQSMKIGKKELSRVSPYFIAVIMKLFETVTVYPVIKVPLLSGCYRLLDLCDDKGILHLNALLTTGSREMFKTLYDQYKKYYQYKGRV